MTAATAPAATDRSDWRTITFNGAKLGVLTAVGVVAFSLLSRTLSGTTETIIQSILILVGGAAFAFLPSTWIRPRTVDGIAWAAMVGLMGALFYTVIDILLLRRLGVYPWTWDRIGGGSTFWYLPVWWMGSALLAWLGAWTVSNQHSPSPLMAAAQAEGLAIILFAVLVATVGPFASAMMALAYALALVVLVPVSAVLGRR